MSTVPIFVYNCSRNISNSHKGNEKIKGIKMGNKEQKFHNMLMTQALACIFAMNPSMPHLVFLMILGKVQVSILTTTRQKFFVLVQ